MTWVCHQGAHRKFDEVGFGKCLDDRSDVGPEQSHQLSVGDVAGRDCQEIMRLVVKSGVHPGSRDPW